MNADLFVFGFIGLSLLLGFVRGFDKQVQQLGKGLIGLIAVVVMIFMFSGFIFGLPFVQALSDWGQEALSDSAAAFLAYDAVYIILKYIVLYVLMTVLLRTALALIGGLVGSTKGGKGSVVNNVFGALMGGAVGIAVVMVILAMVTVLPGTEGLVDTINGSACGIFLDFNPFLGLFGGK